MATLTIKIPEGAINRFSELLRDIGGEVISPEAKTLTGSGKEAALLDQIESGLKDVVAIKEGKIKRISLSEGLCG